MNADNDYIDKDPRSVIMSEIMTPDKVNFNGNVHGGYILELLDKVSYACASRYAAKTIVTLSVDQVFFKEPIYVGELVIFYARINYVGNSSMEVGIRVIAENLQTRNSRHTNTCYFTMVALDENAKPTKVPALTIENATQQRRYDDALKRRESRLQLFTGGKMK
jgi:acyl-CoA hydrolase